MSHTNTDSCNVPYLISISSSSTAASVKCALPSLFASKEKREREDYLQLVADLQGISDYGIAHAKDLNYEAAKVIPITHGKNVMTVLMFESDKQLLLQAIQKDVDFCRYVKDLRGSPNEHKLHSLRIENDIYFELAQLLAPTDVKMNWRMEIILKCPKDEKLANGENIETGGANDEVARNQCASVVAETDIDNNFAFSPIKRGSGTTGSYINARDKCIKDTGPGKCGCKDWQSDEVKRAQHYLETKARYFRSKNIPVAAICFGGTSAKKVMDTLNSSLFDAINCDAHPHLCTLVCAYGYNDLSLQLRTIFAKVGSISSTLDVFWGIVESRYPSFERPTKTMLDALVASKELPMVNEDTPANVEAAKKANRKRISKLMKRLWQDENWRKRTLAARWGKKRKKKMKKVFKDNWKKPEWMANWKAARWSDAQRAEHSDLMKSLFQNPEWRAKWKAARWSDTQRAECSAKRIESMDKPTKKNPAKTLQQLSREGGELLHDKCKVDPELAKTCRDGWSKGGTNSHANKENELIIYVGKQKKHLQKCLQEGKEVSLIQCVYVPKGGKIGCSSKTWRVAAKRKHGNHLQFRFVCRECGIVSGSAKPANFQHLQWKSRGNLHTAELINTAFEEMLKQSSLEEVIIALREKGFNGT